MIEQISELEKDLGHEETTADNIQEKIIKETKKSLHGQPPGNFSDSNWFIGFWTNCCGIKYYFLKARNPKPTATENPEPNSLIKD